MATKWAVLRRGRLISIDSFPDEVVSPPITGPDVSVVLYDEATHGTEIKPVPYKPEFINKDVFLFEMFDIPEQLGLQRLVELIPENADWKAEDEGRTPTTINIYYRGLALSQRQLGNVSRVEIASPRTLSFLDLIFGLGLWGDPTDLANQATFVTRKALFTDVRLPDGRWINEDRTTGEITYDTV